LDHLAGSTRRPSLAIQVSGQAEKDIGIEEATLDWGVRARLSAMMFIQYFIWSAWWVPFGAYMSKNGFDGIIGQVYATQGYAAILAPLFIGAIADRFFPAQKVMGVLHICGAASLAYVSTLGAGANPNLLILGALAAWIFYMPTLPLSTTIAFNAVDDTAKQFPLVRVFGTLGWIAAGLAVGFMQLEQTKTPILMAAAASLLYGLYSFTLPDTPPRAGREKLSVVGILGLDALKGGGRVFQIFILASLITTIPLSFYYAYTNTFLIEAGVQRAAAIQTLGQMSEVVFMLLMPLLFIRMGIKWVMVVGMVAWVARYILFAFGVSSLGPVMPLLLIGILLHGVCYDFFFVAGQIYVDRTFSSETRARAQSFLALITLGVGTALGSLLANAVYVANTNSPTSHDWQTIWLIPAGLAAVTAIVFALVFRERGAASDRSAIAEAAPEQLGSG
jgi:nucleoside transporter